MISKKRNAPASCYPNLFRYDREYEVRVLSESDASVHGSHTSNNSSVMLFTLIDIIFLIGSLLRLAQASTTSCGSLITSRQYSYLLRKSTPDCFLKSCNLTQNTSSLASTCTADSSCHELWTAIVKHSGLDWCDSCRGSYRGGDVACRTHGWPIINATELCQSIPKHWMYTDQQCCGTGSDTFEIAHWINRLCSDEWRKGFHFYGGMAPDDWVDWILPWNWTVHADNSLGTIKAPHCHKASTYLLLFLAENIAWLIGLATFPFIQIGIHYSEHWQFRGKLKRLNTPLRPIKTSVRFVRKAWKIVKEILFWPFKWLWKQVSSLWKSDDDDESVVLDFIQALLMAFISLGWNIGFTFANAYYLKAAPGFEHLPSDLLAFLWLARPNITWITCAIGVLNHKFVTDILVRTTDSAERDWVQNVFLKVVYSAAINELVMELMGSFSIWKTFLRGKERHFYRSHRLWHYYRGHHARTMYNGALVWMITLPAVFLFWLLMAWRFGSLVLVAVHFAKQTKEKEEKFMNLLSSFFGKWWDHYFPGSHVSLPLIQDEIST
jgi:hypothetical protein